MNATSITHLAGLIGEAGRIQMLQTLLDGRSHSASELAVVAGASPQTASSHLAKLLSGGLITFERRGRQRLFRLRNADVATVIEALCALAPNSAPPPIPEIRFARTCYDHLAGVLAIAVSNELLKRDVLRQRGDQFVVTTAGKRFLRKLNIDVENLRSLRRSFARKCLDWTERRPHIGGSVGAAILSRFMETKWLVRMRGTRAVRLTEEGERRLESILGIHCMRLRSPLLRG
jgi:DNA-binding transcriptional ArsR family regulator